MVEFRIPKGRNKTKKLYYNPGIQKSRLWPAESHQGEEGTEEPAMWGETEL